MTLHSMTTKNIFFLLYALKHYSVNYSVSPSFQHENNFKTDQNKKLLSVGIRCTAYASKMVITTNYASLHGRAFSISPFSTGPDIYIRVSWHSCNCFGSCALWLQIRQACETLVTWSAGVARAVPETSGQVLGVTLLWKLRDDSFEGLSVQN